MATKHIPLEAGKFYHIYNRGIDGTDIFKNDDNYKHFLKLYAHHCACVLETYAYCLLGNHFHFLIRVKETLPTYREIYTHLPPEELTEKANKTVNVSRQLGHLFNAYAQAFNHQDTKKEKRTGGLFEEPFERKWVDNEVYFTNLIQYIHQNPQKHDFVKDFRQYAYSSYTAHLSAKPTLLEREKVLAWFGNGAHYTNFHEKDCAEDTIERYMIEK